MLRLSCRTVRAPALPLGDQLLDAGFADADQGELSRYEEAVGQDKEGHHDSPDENPLEHNSMLAGTTKAPRNVALPGRKPTDLWC